MSEIGRKSILRGLGDILGVVDVKSAPAELDTSTVKVVAPLNPGWAAAVPWTRYASGIAIGGLGSGTIAWPVVGDQPQGFSLAIPDSARKRNTAGEENIVLGMSIQFAWANADPFPDQDSEVEIYARMRESFAADPRVVSPFSIPAFTLTGSRLRYAWAYPSWGAKAILAPVSGLGEVYGFTGIGGPSLLVPAGAGLDIVIDHMGLGGTPGGVVFAAGTTMDISSWGISCPKGYAPPGL